MSSGSPYSQVSSYSEETNDAPDIDILPEKVGTPFIQIVEQPQERGHRFRYACEGKSHGVVKGVRSVGKNRTFPAIKIQNYVGPASIRVTLVTDSGKPHDHELTGPHCNEYGQYNISTTASNLPIEFKDLSVVHITQKTAKEKRIKQGLENVKNGRDKQVKGDKDAKRVRLKFEATILDPKTKQPFKLDPVISKTIFDGKGTDTSELRIRRLSRTEAPCNGKTEVFLLCDKINKDDIKVKFFEINAKGQLQWESYAAFGNEDVHYQVVIVFRTPSYLDATLREEKQVKIQLERPSDGALSEFVNFTFRAAVSQEMDYLNKKRKKPIPAIVDSITPATGRSRGRGARSGGGNGKKTTSGQLTNGAAASPITACNGSALLGRDGHTLSPQGFYLPNTIEPQRTGPSNIDILLNEPPPSHANRTVKDEFMVSRNRAATATTTVQMTTHNVMSTGISTRPQGVNMNGAVSNTSIAGTNFVELQPVPLDPGRDLVNANGTNSAGPPGLQVQREGDKVYVSLDGIDWTELQANEIYDIAGKKFIADESGELHPWEDIQDFLANSPEVAEVLTISHGSPAMLPDDDLNGVIMNFDQPSSNIYDPMSGQMITAQSNFLTQIGNNEVQSAVQSLPVMLVDVETDFVHDLDEPRGTDTDAVPDFSSYPIGRKTDTDRAIGKSRKSDTFDDVALPNPTIKSAVMKETCLDHSLSQLSYTGASFSSILDSGVDSLTSLCIENEGKTTSTTMQIKFNEEPPRDATKPSPRKSETQDDTEKERTKTESQSDDNSTAGDSKTGSQSNTTSDQSQLGGGRITSKPDAQSKTSTNQTQLDGSKMTSKPDALSKTSTNQSQLDGTRMKAPAKCSDTSSPSKSKVTPTGRSRQIIALGPANTQRIVKATDPYRSDRDCIVVSGQASNASMVLAEKWNKGLKYFASTGDIQYLLALQRHLIDVPDGSGDNALHLAVIHDQIEALRHLLSVNATIRNVDAVNARNDKQQTPLHCAVLCNNDYMVELLMEHGARLDIPNSQGYSPLQMAARHGLHRCIQSILSKCHSQEEIQNALERRDYEGLCALHLAVHSGILRCVEHLVAAGADINVRDGRCGYTPLHHATEREFSNIVGYLIMQLHIQPDVPSFSEVTALHIAVSRNNLGIAAALITAGADPEAESAEPLESADDSDDDAEATSGSDVTAGDNRALSDNREEQTTVSDNKDMSDKREQKTAVSDNGAVSDNREEQTAADDNKGDMNAEGGTKTKAGKEVKYLTPMDMARGNPQMLRILRGVPYSEVRRQSSVTPDNALLSTVLQGMGRMSLVSLPHTDTLSSLDVTARLQLCRLLDPPQQSHDWRALADLCDLGEHVNFFSTCRSPTSALLENLEAQDLPLATLQDRLAVLQRTDAIKVIQEYLGLEQQTRADMAKYKGSV